MRSVDLRTRTGADVRSVDAEDFFGEELPARLADAAPLALDGARQLGVRPFGFDVEGRTWTARLTDDGAFTVEPGLDGADAVVRLDAVGLHDLVNDLRTPMGFLTGGDLDMPQGRLEDFLDWWVVLRSALDERRVHVAGDISFDDVDGRPLDLGRAFRIDDDPDEISWFLAEAGFLHLRDVFDADEMAAVSAEMDAAAPRYAKDDGRSWWAKTHDGTDRLVRMQYFQQESPATASLLASDRLQAIAGFASDGHRHGKPGGNGNLVEALVKPVGVVEGISDVPWHKDCSLGSHSYRCCSLTVGISSPAPVPGRGSCGSSPGRIAPSSSRRSCGASSTSPNSTCRPAPAT